ncbi:MAG: TfoX/Sxy family protein [Bacteroidales bacterium]|jgi:DNA transformation protein|nr:TfoX/Sxy family protein [Bacteroidales bacterium]
MNAPLNYLTQLPNLGKTLAVKLIQAGIHNPIELQSAGAENAFLRIRAIDPDACLNMLLALEGAIQGIRWHNLDPSRKEELKAFFRMAEKQPGKA